VIRRGLLAVGFASTGAGLWLLVTPAGVPVSVPLLPALGLVALVALGVGGLVALDRAAGGVRVYDLSDPAAGVRVPGDAFDDRLDAVSVRTDADDRAAIRGRVETVAVAVLVENEGVTRAVARDRLDEGDWPGDRRARAFFTERPPSLRERVRTVVTGDPTFVRRARRAIAAVAAHAEREGKQG
jgi:hypothetical protein